jgi:hypothetical protein
MSNTPAHFSSMNWQVEDSPDRSASMAKLEDWWLNVATVSTSQTPEVAARSAVQDVFADQYVNEDRAIAAWTEIIKLRRAKTLPKPPKRTTSTRTRSSLDKRRSYRVEARAIPSKRTKVTYPNGVHIHSDGTITPL